MAENSKRPPAASVLGPGARKCAFTVFEAGLVNAFRAVGETMELSVLLDETQIAFAEGCRAGRFAR